MATIRANAFLVLVLSIVLLLSSYRTPLATVLLADKNTTSTQEDGWWKRPNVVYGLVHMAKTAGTEINGELANHFERVCGNKGYSYDALETNKRTKNFPLKPGQHITTANLSDAVSKLYPYNNRGNPPPQFSAEIGYDDCDYIALETKAGDWSKFTSLFPMELHVPCREPLDSLMSQANFRMKTFICNASNLEAEIDRHVLYLDRFQDTLENSPNITVKCFNPFPVHRYLDYMGNILQRKRIESEYFHRDMNRKRDMDKECIWKAGPEFQDKVRSIMLQKYEWYNFCDRCIGSDQELPL